MEAASFVAGHSLGEYSALAAAGTFTVADAARLLRKRGEAMQAAVPVGQGAMAAVLGLDFDGVTALAEKAAQGDVCQVANQNDPTQNVISGSKAAVAMMGPAADVMAQALGEVEMAAPAVPVVANVVAEAVSEPDRIRELLVEQVTGQVRWMSSVEWMGAQGVTEIWEIGAGKALSGMIRRINKEIECRAVLSPDDVKAAAAAMEG